MTRHPLRLVAVCLLFVLGAPSALYAIQTRLIFPGAATQGTDGARVDPPAGAELIALTTTHGDRVSALFATALTDDGRPHPDAARRPTLLYFYGNGMYLRSAVDYELERFRRLGVNVLIPEYVGYGLSGGRPSEAGCYDTADAAYEHLLKRPGMKPGSVIVLGRSLGGAVAIDLAARRKVGGLIVLSTFTSMVEMVNKQFPGVPLSLLLRHRFESLAKIDRVTCPILIGNGSADELVPPAMSARLAAAAKATVSTFTVAGAHHNDLEEIGGDQVAGELRKFIERMTVQGDDVPGPRTPVAPRRFRYPRASPFVRPVRVP